MSGQTAVDLVSRFGDRVTHLVLCAPGIYSATLRDIPFGDSSFKSLAFETPHIWQDSPALDVLAVFKGRILLVLPGHDEEVPAGMADLIERTLRANPATRTLLLAEAGHLLDSWIARHPVDRQAVTDALCGPLRD
ncbi:alpha/beta fold hydrolase [Streptomyces sp. NBC_00859]|uniref:alpha/beta fold hydrolase n=1 Tax=Streptomyces sp. NBC_00859 TaxID=2903682 RepID=UPI003865EB4F|nr:hypothetical protein OG584_33775 [Streptomyces sp. NBC_00859]